MYPRLFPGLYAAIFLIFLNPGQAVADAPRIAEPMVFDMVRPLGAQAGELEANSLAQVNLSGPERPVEWAPEIELAVADGLAVEVELPLTNRKVTAYKMGLQGTFGTFRDGRSIHGVQYLGVYDRAEGRWFSTLLYLLGNRLNERWSMMTMIGVGDFSPGRGGGAGMIVNHSTFYDVNDDAVFGVELNWQTGEGRRRMIMPQWQQRLGRWSVQAGLGAEKAGGDGFRPRMAARLIREF